MQLKTKTMLSFLLVLLFTLCFSKDTITVNQTFKEGDLLISEQKNFALGFFSPGSSTYRYLGIWFHKIPGQTVVWVANRNSPFSGFPGYLSINQQGNLVLYGENNPVWSTNVSTEATDTLAAKLLDSGNLVLVQGRSERVVWQSFDHPTNTFLPGMKVGLNRKTGANWFLTSWRSAHDPATGNYSYKLNPSGSPQFFLYSGTKQYWRTSAWPWKAYPEIYYFNFVDHQDELYYNFSFYDASIIAREVLDESGFLRMLTWHQSDGQWKEFSSVPKDRCDFLGQCGAYGRCDSNTVNRFECTCLPGYEPKSPREWHLRNGRSGCVRKRLKSSSVCGHGEGFIKVESVKLPDSAAAVWVDMSMSQFDCEQECKNDCSCSAFSSIPIAGNGSACLAWYGELIDTVTYKADMGRDLYVRVDALELGESVTRSSGFLGKKGVLSTLILSVASGWLVITIVFYFWFKSRKNKRTIKNKRNRKMFDPINSSNYFEGGSSSHPDLILFNFSTILAATNNFSPANKIGQGGFGIVYKGQLPDGQEIAVKRMSNSSRQGIQEFKNEAMLISKLQHKNLVKLLGCCIKRKEQILIYEYLPNKSLDSFIFDEKRGSLMDWRKRFDIIVGIVRGILYLHQDSRLTVIHRDLKSSNILLDADMNPKISDFGMATTFHGDQIQGKTNRVVGTYGYMSPEYAVLGKFSVKSDVFSFGVIVLEIISGKKSNGFNQQDPSLSLIGQVWELWNEGRALEIVDSSLTESYYISAEALRCIQIGLLCVQEDAMDRPTMLEVILMLKSETPLPSPKQPAFIFRTSSCNTKSPEEEVRTCSINEVTMSAVLTR